MPGDLPPGTGVPAKQGCGTTNAEAQSNSKCEFFWYNPSPWLVLPYGLTLWTRRPAKCGKVLPLKS